LLSRNCCPAVDPKWQTSPEGIKNIPENSTPNSSRNFTYICRKKMHGEIGISKIMRYTMYMYIP